MTEEQIVYSNLKGKDDFIYSTKCTYLKTSCRKKISCREVFYFLFFSDKYPPPFNVKKNCEKLNEGKK